MYINIKKYFICLLIFICLIFFFLFFKIKAEKNPKVSVIVPVYKVEPWIRECMDSLVNQTLNLKKEIEIICIDDGSPDNCGKILDEYKQKYSSVKVIHQKNGGLSNARNSGLDIATGEYITFVDSDDYLDTSAYETAYNYAKKDNIDILHFQHRRFEDGQDNHINNIDFLDSKVISCKDYIYDCKYGSVVWNRLFKHEIIKKYKLRFIEGLTPGEDDCFLYMTLGSAQKIKIIPAEFYNYRQRNGSLMTIAHSKTQQQIWNHFIKLEIFKQICDSWRQQNCIKNREIELLTLITRFLNRDGTDEYVLPYAQEILKQIGSDILNPENIKKCPDYIQDYIKKLEYSAASNKDPPLKNGIYCISSAVNNYKSCLDIYGASKEDDANLNLWEKNETSAQKFEIKRQKGGYYTIKALCSGKMLDVNMASKELGTNIKQYKKNGNQAQYWYIIPCDDGNFNIISVCNLLAMDVSGGKTENGTNIQCWKINNSKAQKFKFIEKL